MNENKIKEMVLKNHLKKKESLNDNQKVIVSNVETKKDGYTTKQKVFKNVSGKERNEILKSNCGIDAKELLTETLKDNSFNGGIVHSGVVSFLSNMLNKETRKETKTQYGNNL